jgi:hypothetical protein
MTPGFPDVDMGSSFWDICSRVRPRGQPSPGLPDRLERRNAPAYARRMLGCPCAEGRADDAYLNEATAPLPPPHRLPHLRGARAMALRIGLTYLVPFCVSNQLRNPCSERETAVSKEPRSQSEAHTLVRPEATGAVPRPPGTLDSFGHGPYCPDLKSRGECHAPAVGCSPVSHRGLDRWLRSI